MDEATQFEILDHNIAAGYVTYIVDLWEGDRTDPAVGVTRYIGVWDENVLETEERGAFNPDFTSASGSYYSGSRMKPPALVWTEIGQTKKQVREAEQFKSQLNNLMNNDRYSYGVAASTKDRFQKFMAAIDKLATDNSDAEAWEAVHAWRERLALAYEK